MEFILASIGLALKYLRDEKVFLILAILLDSFCSLGYKFSINVNQLSTPINFVMTVFGLFLVYAGIKSQKYDVTMMKILVKQLQTVSFIKFDNYVMETNFTIQNGVRMATPLLIVVAVIEFTDVLFAVDSIPANFAISKDPHSLYL
jgi:tellurite resistance protein TerC